MYVIHHGYAPGDESIRLLYDLTKDKLQLAPERIEFPQNHPIADGLDRKLRSWIKRMKDPFLL